MPNPFKAFLYIFALVTLFGLLVGTLNLLNPQAVHIPFGKNGESAEGLDGVLASLASSAVLGVIFGSLAAFFAWLFSFGVKRSIGNNETEDKTKKTESQHGNYP